MAWWDALIDFGSKNADWLAPVAGAAAGALSGGRDQKSTQTTQVNMPDNVRGAYDKLINYAGENFDRPIQAAPTRRVTAPTNAYDALFVNPELLAIQQQADAAYNAPKSTAPQIDMTKGRDGTYSQPNNYAVEAALRSGSTGDRYLDSQGQRLLALKGMDGQTNAFNGKTFSYGDMLEQIADYQNAGGSNTLGFRTPEANNAFSKLAENKIAAEYDPRDSWLSRFAPMIAGGLLAGPAMLGAAGLAGPAATPLQSAIVNAGNWAGRGISQVGSQLGGSR